MYGIAACVLLHAGAASADAASARVAMGVHDGVMLLDTASPGQPTSVTTPRDAVGFSFDDVHRRLWVLTRDRRLTAYDMQGTSSLSLLLPRSADAGGNIPDWLASGWGGGSQHVYLPDDIAAGALSVDKRDGSVWVGVNSALFKYSATGSLLRVIAVQAGVRQLAFDWKPETLWVATYDDVVALDPNGATLGDLKSGYFSQVVGIAFDERLGALWMNTGFAVLGFDRNRALAYSFGGVRQFVYQAVPDGRGDLWLLTDGGLQRTGTDGNPQLYPRLPDHDVPVTLAPDVNDASVWVLGHSGVYRIDAQGGATLELSFHRDQGGGHGDDGSHDSRESHVASPVPGLSYSASADLSWIALYGVGELLGGAASSQQGHDSQYGDDSGGSGLLLVNGDIHAPALSLTAPAANALVGPKPAITLLYTDVGLGVNLADTVLTVNGSTTPVNCSGDANGATCTPVTALATDPASLSLTVTDFAGNVSVAAGISVLLDTDGDGHDDNHDTYPTDPGRWRLPAVTGLVPSLAGTAVRLDWAGAADQQNTAGYYVYRSMLDGVETRLTSTPVNAVNYTDSTVANGSGYHYRVTAVDRKGNEGEPGTAVDFFVAYNHTPITGLSVARQKASAALAWTAVTGMTYQVYRAEEGGAAAPLAETGSNAYLDGTPLWFKSYTYQVATLQSFTDPFTHAAVKVVGPLSAPVALLPLPPLSIAINGGIAGADGVPQFIITQGPVSVAGGYGQAIGPVTITAVGSGQTVTVHTSDGSFRLSLPAAADSVWTVTASEDTVADRTASTSLHLVKDTAAPAVTFDDGLSTQVTDSNYTVSGTAKDALTGIAQLYLTSSRYDGQHFVLSQGADGSFSGSVPLEYGSNVLTAQAVDGAGNQVTASLNVNRSAPLQPTLTVTSPQSGVTVDTNHVAVSGIVYTGLTKDKVRITVNGQSLFPSSGASTQGYPFTVASVPLTEGYNNIQVTVDTPAGSAQQSIAVNYTTKPVTPPQPQPPTLTITSPANDSPVNGDSITLAGNVDPGDILTVNGQSVATDPDGDFQYTLALGGCAGGSVAVSVIATGPSGLTTTRNLSFTCDKDPPVITLANSGLQAPPTVNRVIDTPYVLSGSVSDANLAGFSINGQAAVVVPAGAGVYSFSVPLALPIGTPQTVSLEAWDAAGNTASRDVVLNDVPVASIEIVAPADGAEILSSDAGAAVDVVARITGLIPGETVGISPDGGAVQAMTLDSDVATTHLVTSLNSGSHKLAVQVLDANQAVQASAAVNISFVNTDSIPVAMDHSEPANGDTGVEPTAPITIYFNKAVDPSKLSISVKETVHGMDYDLSNQQGVGFTQIPDPQLVQVDRDMQDVTGPIQLYPEGKFATFTPAPRLAYGANEYVDVQYDGQDLARFSYQVQPLPTIIAGNVTDENGVPLSGISVQLASAGLTTTTDDAGNYSFGSGSQLHTALPGGIQNITANPRMSNALYGSVTFAANLQQNRLNNLPPLRLTTISPAVPYVNLAGGNPQIELAGGALRLDLSQATLAFPDTGRDSGPVHVDFLMAGQFTFPTTSAANPSWLYGIQPAGITVQGNVAVSMDAPTQFGNYAYLPPDGTLVVIVGLDTASQTIAPVGIGTISGHTIQSIGSLDLSRLDYIGYVILDPKLQPMLADFRDGKLGSLTALRSALNAAAGQ